MKEIKLTQGKVALVDDEDYEYLNQWKWIANKSYTREVHYVVRNKKIDGKWKQVRMHRLIMYAPKGMHVDHKDRNGLNNQRSNLRICSNIQNCYNRGANKGGSSKYKGVCFCNTHRRWRARLMINGNAKMLGYFKTELEAGIIINIAARKYHGEFSRPNILTKISY